MPQNAPYSPFAPLLTLRREDLVGLSPNSAKGLLAAVLSALPKATIQNCAELSRALQHLVFQLEDHRAMGAISLSAVLRKVSADLPAEHDLTVVAAHVTCLAGNREGQNRNFKAAAKRQAWSMNTLAGRWNGRAVELWAYAMERRVHWLCRDKQLDSAKALVEELVEYAATAKNGWVNNRALEADWRWCNHAIGESRYREIAGLATLGLALPMVDDDIYTHESIFELCSLNADAHRDLGLPEISLENCQRARDFPHPAATRQAQRALAWCLAEGACVASSKLQLIDQALLFCKRLEEVFAETTDPDIQALVAHALSVRGNCYMQLGDPEQAQTTLDLMEAKFSVSDKRNNVRAALADAWLVRARVHAHLGESRKAAHRLRRLVEQFSEETESAIVETVEEARRLLAS